jgi:hypothetical protein
VLRLVRAHAAADRAGRLIDALDGLTTEAMAFRDHVPGVLAQLDVVTTLIDSESKGNRAPAFSTWWKAQDRKLQLAVRELRNAELKKQEPQTSLSATVYVGGLVAPTGAVSLQVNGVPVETGSDSEDRSTPAPVESGTTGRMFWTFNSGDFADREVIPILREYHRWLISDVLPTAERLLTPPSSG